MANLSVLAAAVLVAVGLALLGQWQIGLVFLIFFLLFSATAP